MKNNGIQKILVFQQNKSGEGKIEGIRKYGENLFSLDIISINIPLPLVIDDAREYLPSDIQADLILDFLKHPDLSQDLANICSNKNIPVVASGKKLRVNNVITPPTWCGLARQDCLGHYGKRFGAPKFKVSVSDEKIEHIQVIRGAPCGATWEAAERIKGLSVTEAVIRIGLETQFFCIANPAGWDPIYGKSPVHFAGEIHSAALKKALK